MSQARFDAPAKPSQAPKVTVQLASPDHADVLGKGPTYAVACYEGALPWIAQLEFEGKSGPVVKVQNVQATCLGSVAQPVRPD